MKRYSFFILCMMLGLLSAVAAAPGSLQGRVCDAITGEPISGVIVKAKSVFVSTGSDGEFNLSLKTTVDSVSFRSIGYESLVLPASSDFLNVHLNPKATQLNDVIVEAPDIYAKGDTLVFNVDRYANAKDNAIIDVIKRLPGIKVKDDGTIEYQGKPISKFYLDGNDFIGGQYGLATNNISHKDVKAVEVMENHQPVKALEGIEFPEEAGINLKLKDDAKSRWVGVGQAAAGVQPFLFDGSLFTMRMAPKIQNIYTLKADNTGWNPVNEIRDHDLDLSFSSGLPYSIWPEYISADLINAPLSENRTRDNLSWLADAITAWKVGDTSMRIKLDYISDRLDYNSGERTEYFNANIPSFIRNNVERTQSHKVSAQFYSETNRRSYYLKEKLNLSGIWDDSNSSITGSFDLKQNVGRRNFSAVNDLNLVKRNDKRLFTVMSRTSFLHSPVSLMVSGEENAVQTIGTTDFRNITETRIGKLTRFWKFYLTAGIDLNYHRMNSSLNGFGEQFDNSGVHQAFLSNLYASPQVDYERNGWRMSLILPLKWLHYSLSGQHNYINLSPRFKVRKQLSAKSELSMAMTYKLSSPKAYLNIGVPVLADYRNLFISTNPDKYTQELDGSISYLYRNPMKSLFINVQGSYDYRRSFIMSNQLFTDDFIISTYTDCLSNATTCKLNGDISKGLGHSKMVIGIKAETSFSSASSMRNNTIIPFKQLYLGGKSYLKGSILKWLSANYEIEYSLSQLSINQERSTYHTLHQNLFTTIIPEDLVQITFGAEHYYTRFPDSNKANLILLDASAIWRVTNKIRLSITANNLLNKRKYEYVIYGVLSSSEHTFQLRQRSILASIQYRF